MSRLSRSLATVIVVLLAFACGAAATFGVWHFDGRLKDIPPAPASAVAREHFACLSYTPYRDGQSPFVKDFVVPPAQIEEDMAFLAKYTDCVRTYSTGQGLDKVVPIAAKYGIKVMLGAWIGSDEKDNAREVKTLIALANAYPKTVSSVIVGNEVLLRRDQTRGQLDAYIRQVKAAVPVPVTYADVWEFWLRNPQLAKNVDFISVHMLPYWEDQPIAVPGALKHVRAVLARVKAAFPGRTIFVGEIGWPSMGRMRQDARPSLSDETRFIREFIGVSQSFGVGYNLIEAFDQKWKRASEGTVGGHWGIFDSERRPKVTLTGPVSDDPFWRSYWQTGVILGGVLLAFALFRREGRAARYPWLFAAGFLAACAGSGIEAQSVYVENTARTTMDWIGAGGGIALSALAAFLALDVLLDRAQGVPLPQRAPTDAVLESVVKRRFPLSRGFLLGAVETLVLTFGLAAALALLTDGRYRDFPTFVYLVPAVSFTVLRISGCVTPTKGERAAYLMTMVLAIVAVGTVINETIRNTQALGWAATALVLSAPWLWDLVRTVQSRARAISPSTSPSEAGSAL